MLHWPPASVLTPVAKANLDRFRRTTAARELEEDPRSWSVVAWSWTAEPTVHVSVRSSHDERLYALDESGLWDVVSTDLVGPPPVATSAPVDDDSGPHRKLSRWLHAALHRGEAAHRGLS